MKKVLGIILNNPAKEMKILTTYRNPITMPFASRYRLVDFALSNMTNSGVKKVGVFASNKYRSLIDHVGTGQAWSFSRKSQELLMLQGSQRMQRSAYQFVNLMDFIGNYGTFHRSKYDNMIIVQPNLICNMDYNEILEQHILKDSDITLVTTHKMEDCQNPAVECIEFATDKGRVSKIYRGCDSNADSVYAGMLIVKRDVMFKLVEWAEDVRKFELMDLLPLCMQDLTIDTFQYNGYLRSVDSIESYFECSMDLLDLQLSKKLLLQMDYLRALCLQIY